MTSNQIAYWKNLETERSDRENERLKSESQAEDRRHNTVTEAKDWFGVKENQRHNQATESVERGKLIETIDHNRATEALEGHKQEETNRHNLATEEVDRRNAASNEQNAKTKANEFYLKEYEEHPIGMRSDSRYFEQTDTVGGALIAGGRWGLTQGIPALGGVLKNVGSGSSSSSGVRPNTTMDDWRASQQAQGKPVTKHR